MCISSDGKDILTRLTHVPLDWQFSYMYMIVVIVDVVDITSILFMYSETDHKGH